MKSKTSITLSAALLEDLDHLVAEGGSRSEFIERAVRDYIERLVRLERDRDDLAILNRNAKRMRREAMDILSYQVTL